MEKILEKSKYLVLIAVISLLLASLAAFLWGAIKTLNIIIDLVISQGRYPFAAISLIELMDTFLIATALFIFSVGLFELFIKNLNIPQWLIIHNLYDLKTKLSSIIILVMAVTFLKHLVEWKDPQGILFYGISIALVSAVLIAFSYFLGKEE